MGTLDLRKPMNDAPATQEKPTFATQLKKKMVSVISEPKKLDAFISDVVALLNRTPDLAKCDEITLMSAVLQAQSLNLSLNPSMGQCYLIPFNNKNAPKPSATFQMGYKGYLQLAMRTGVYKNINVVELKQGELIKWNRLTEELIIDFIEDDFQRESTPTSHYVAYFEYLNGFSKTLLWTREKMISHADKYSQAFKKDAHTRIVKNQTRNLVSATDFLDGKYNKSDEWLYSSFWYKDFDGMAFKTMLRQLISKWGIMSVEMQTAFDSDYHTINEELKPTGDFIDADFEETPPSDEQKTPPKEKKTKKETPSEPQAEAYKPPKMISCPKNEEEVLNTVCDKYDSRNDCPAHE